MPLLILGIITPTPYHTSQISVFGPNTAYPEKSGMKISERTHYRQQGVAWQDNSSPRTRLTMFLEGKLGPRPALVETLKISHQISFRCVVVTSLFSNHVKLEYPSQNFPYII
jgi:hypothetical protein